MLTNSDNLFRIDECTFQKICVCDKAKDFVEKEKIIIQELRFMWSRNFALDLNTGIQEEPKKYCLRVQRFEILLAI